ncbi:hypothetical protein [Kineococcus gypseus]|uniref:hypothetical protein n=1 Tax=Kineococcus gypseus TaxID=1637102 RepID=UPI003D7C8FE8
MKRTARTTAALAAALVLVGAPPATAAGPAGPPGTAGTAADPSPVPVEGPAVSLGTEFTGLSDGDLVAGNRLVEGRLGAISRAWAWQEGELTDIGPFDGEGSTRATAVGAAGQVLGTSTSPSTDEVGFLWQDGAVRALGTGQDRFVPVDVDDAGRVLGTGTTADGARRAMLWRDGALTTLPAPSGCTQTYATALDERGTAVGTCYAGTERRYALLWQDAGRRVRALDPSMRVLDVDGRGRLAGQDLSTQRATVWAPRGRGGWRALDLGAAPGASAEDFGRDGEVAVTEPDAGGAGSRVLLWRHGRLSALPGGEGYEAVAANALGHVLGASYGNPALLWR